MTTALSVCTSALRQANLITSFNSFGSTEFPGSICRDLMNLVISELNQFSTFYWLVKKTVLPYSAGVSQYTLSLQNPKIAGNKIKSIRRTLPANSKGYLTQQPYDVFEATYLNSTLTTGVPTVFACDNDTLYLNAIPDQDYGLTVRHVKKMGILPADTTAANAHELECPEEHLDIFVEGVLAYILHRVGRVEWKDVYASFRQKALMQSSDSQINKGMPTMMPSQF